MLAIPRDAPLIRRKPVGSGVKPKPELKDGTLGIIEKEVNRPVGLKENTSSVEPNELSYAPEKDLGLHDQIANVPDTAKEELRPDLDEQLEKLQLENDEDDPPPDYIEDELAENRDTQQSGAEDQDVVAGAETEARKSSKSAKLKHAYGEVKHYTGGLISKPYEATKSYSIVRHSHGLVFYKGPTTSIAITIFTDQPLPADRTLWLQKKGFSGKMGMKLRAKHGSRNAWIDVTPTIDSTADLLPHADERAWQRDMTKFEKRVKDKKNLCNHRPYETNLVRIPHVAQDGYFRIVLCAGDTVLCPSPVFRYASSSMDPSNLRGAGLRMLPLEIGLKIGSAVARHTVNTAAAGAVQPALTTVQSFTQYEPNALEQWAASAAYDTSGAAAKVDEKVDAVNQQYEESRGLDFTSIAGNAVEGTRLVGSGDGPEPPYPIRFSGRLSPIMEKKGLQFGLPAACVNDVDGDTLLRLSGVYMAWVSTSATQRPALDPLQKGAGLAWYQAAILVLPELSQASVVQGRCMFVFLCEHSDETLTVDSKMSVILMGFLQDHGSFIDGPYANPKLQEKQMQDAIATAKLSLSRPDWTPEVVLERIKSESSTRSYTQRIADARKASQTRFDKIPLHKFGVRTNSMGLKDQLIGNGGVCIKR